MKRKTQVKWTNTANEINRRIEDNFQGRLDEIRIFHERTNYLVNHMHSDSLVTNYYGFGGIGKTWLLKRLEEEAGKRGSGFVRYEFDTISTDSAGATLLSLAFSIGKAYGGHIWDRTIDLLKKYGSDGSILEQDFSKAEKTYDAAGKAVNAGLKIAAFSVPGSQILQVLTVINKNYKILKSLRKSGLIIAGQFDSKEYDTAEGTYDNEETLARELADAFCADLKILLAGLERPLVIALDGLDRFYKNNTDDAWLKQIIMDLDDIHWILAGRDRLNWEEEVWTAEAEDNMPHLLPVQLGALSEEETKTYFCRAEVVREEDNDFSEYLYQLTDGIPLYMYLCVDIYVNLVNRGESVTKETFGIEIDDDEKNRHHTKLIRRWADRDIGKIRELAAIWKWNDTILKDDQSAITNKTRNWFAEAKDKSIFRYDISGNVSFHDVIQEVIVTDAFSRKLKGFMVLLRRDSEYFMDAIGQEKKNEAVVYVAIDVLQEYLSMKNHDWYSDKVNTHSMVMSLGESCNWLDDIGDWQFQVNLSERLLTIAEEDSKFTEVDRSDFYSLFANACLNMGNYDQALKYNHKSLKISEEVLGKEHPSTAVIHNNLALVYRRMDDYGSALEYCQKALAINEKVFGKDHPSTATTYSNLALIYEKIGDYGIALEYCLKALKIREEAAESDCSLVATTCNNLAGIYEEMGDYGNALSFFQKALKINEEALGREHPTTAAIYNNLALVYEKTADYGNALEYYQKAVKINEDVLGKDHPLMAATYNNLALLYGKKGDFSNALEYSLKALGISEKVFGKDHLSTAAAYNNLANVYEKTGNYAEALGYCQKVLKIREKALGQKHPLTATAYNNLASLYEDMGDYDMALEYCRKALKIREEIFGQNHPLNATVYNNLGDVYREMGNYGNALEYFQKSLVITEEAFGHDHPSTAMSYNNLGDVCREMGNYDKALECLQTALSIFEKTLGHNHPSTAVTYNNLASVYISKGNYDKALECYQQSLDIKEKVLGKFHPSTATTYDNLALLTYQMGDLRTAANNLFQVLNIYENISGSEHTDTITAKKNLLVVANAYLAQGNSSADLDQELVMWLDQNMTDDDTHE